ncbi:glycoside hydrolase family 31 protein [Paenibacillus sp. strain BS8-2]
MNHVLETNSWRDQTLFHYVQLRQQRIEQVANYIDHATALLDMNDNEPLQCAYWLWLISEYSVASGDVTRIQANVDMVQKCIAIIDRNWQETTPHWLWEDRQGVYLSHLAIYYAALRSAAQAIKSEDVQRIGKEIRSTLFTDYVIGTHLVSEKGTDVVWEDVILAAVPFGFISAGDLALLKSLERLDEKGAKGDYAAILSWYYSECGRGARAKTLLEQAVNSSNEDEPSIWIQIAQSQLRSSDQLKRVHFRHEPLGSECPYMFGADERSPRLVTAGEDVIVRTVIESEIQPPLVWLHYHAADGAEHVVEMSMGDRVESDAYWQATIPACGEQVEVGYYFVAQGDWGLIESERFTYNVLKWANLDVADGILQRENRLVLRYRSSEAEQLNDHRAIQLELWKTGEGVACSLDWDVSEEQDLGTDDSVSQHQDGTYRIGHIQLTVAEGEVSWGRVDESGMAISIEMPGHDFARIQVLTDQQGRTHKVRWNSRLTDEEKLYGLGERFAGMEFRGQELDNYVFNQYKDQGYRTYMPTPLVLSSEGYGLFLESTLYSVFRCGSQQPELMQIEASVRPDAPAMTLHMFHGGLLKQIEQYTDLTGKPKLPPKWAFGPWMSSNNWDSEKETDWQLEQNRRYEIPATVMVLEQWSDESTFYIFNDAQYEEKDGDERFRYNDFTFPEWGRWPNPKKLVERIHEQGIKLLLWQAPVMKYMDGIAHAQRDEDERAMIAGEHAVKNGDGTPYRIPSYEWFRGSLVPDFTSVAASEWWLSKRQYLLDELLIDGFKTDGGECIYGSDVQFHDGRSGAEMRNSYPNVYIGAFHSIANRFVEGGAITFSRAGYSGAQSMPLHWAGDEKSTFEAYRASVVAGLSSGLSGVPFWGWDLGGFSGEIPTAELYIRSVQMAVFCPVMQYHAESKGQFNLDRTPWNIAERTGCPEVLTEYKRYADLRMNLLPYIYEQAERSSRTGHPLMRAMLLDYGGDPTCAGLTQQYMFGEELLVAPILEEGATEVELYLPQGSWLPLLHGRDALHSTGQWVTVEADLSSIPVYMRANSVVPLNLNDKVELASHVGNAVDSYKQLSMMIFVADSLDYRFEDELGTMVTIQATISEGEIDAEVELKSTESVVLCFRSIGTATSVTVGGNDLAIVHNANERGVGSCLQREQDVLITLATGESSIRIRRG